jgi:hypothetical protein
MKLTAAEIQTIQQRLRNVAEVDENDTIANRASQLSVDLEYVRVPFDYNSLEEHLQNLIQYAIQKRDVYVLLPGNRHAVNLERVEKPRRTIAKRIAA